MGGKMLVLVLVAAKRDETPTRSPVKDRKRKRIGISQVRRVGTKTPTIVMILASFMSARFKT